MMWTKVIVKHVIDGDTLVVDFEEFKNIKVRIIGIDTPEKFESKKLNSQAKLLNIPSYTVQHLGNLSTTYTRHSLPLDSNIKLSVRGLDVYNRYLVWIKGFNMQIVRDGYALAFDSSDLDEKIVKKLYLLEAIAKKTKKGFWSEIERSQL